MPKDIQFLCKRRKNQLINHELNKVLNYNTLHLIKLDEASSAMTNTKTTMINSVETSKINISQDEDENNELSAQLLSDNENVQHNSELQESFSTDSECNNGTTLTEDLQQFIIERCISHNTSNKLLQILRKHGHVELPTDVRVLVKTPRNTSATFISLGSGKYIHFGLASGLKRSIKMYSNFINDNNIKININVDGLPISKSSGSQFWPIMISIQDIDIYTLPVIIGVYHGMCKPNNCNDFLANFVDELVLLSKNGIIVSNKKYVVIVNAIVCDAPAKSFITCTKGHTGYFACSKCIQEGDFVRNRVIFPETNNALRTDQSFRNRTQSEHHNGDSILERLSIDMVLQIGLDYMHLVCLGVMKRMLQLWVRGKKDVRLVTGDVDSVSHDLLAIKYCISSEFSRKPRSLNDVDRWKATEFRQFLLYTGIIVMKSVLSPYCYNHFVTLSIAVRILADPQLCISFNDYANSLLIWFVSNFGNIYGDEYLSYNVHNLLHIAKDVQTFGCLDNFSCFKYENYMQKIKRKLHQSGKPLEELSNRIFEESQLPIQPFRVMQYPIIIFKNNRISYLQFQNFKIGINEIDNCVLIDNKSVAFILEIFEENNVLFVLAQCFLNPTSFFTTPCPSERLGIFQIAKNTTSNTIKIPVTRITRKCLKVKNLSEVGSYITIPLLLTATENTV
ncbi:uncharacterized protein [Linepithema humile]|uniref:uncharacterized protein isoform X1 n=1 Tax=Linepithema humile TaxID=83485 RepID=UPI00351EADC9